MLYFLLVTFNSQFVNIAQFLRNHTWTATHSVLYVDNPVGTGFSFTEKDACYATDQNQVRMREREEQELGQKCLELELTVKIVQVANDLYDALQQFFLLFPQLQRNDFYATGESYAGKYVPAISYKVADTKMCLNGSQIVGLKM